MKSTETFFRLTNRFRSGIEQVTKGKIQEVKVARVTLNKKVVSNETKILNNHDSLIMKDVSGKDILYMFITKNKSKGICEIRGKSYDNILINGKKTIEGRNGEQYISSVGVEVGWDTTKYNDSLKAEEFTMRNSGIITQKLNQNFGSIVIKLKNNAVENN